MFGHTLLQSLACSGIRKVSNESTQFVALSTSKSETAEPRHKNRT